MKRTPNVALIGIMLAALVIIAVVAFTAWTRLATPENVNGRKATDLPPPSKSAVRSP